MTIYTDSLSNIKKYKNDYYTIAVSPTLPHHIQNNIDAWFIDLAPSRLLNDMLEKESIDFKEFSNLYKKEMNNKFSKSKIKWIKEYSKNNDLVILCFEDESTNKCHRHILKEIIENC